MKYAKTDYFSITVLVIEVMTNTITFLLYISVGNRTVVVIGTVTKYVPIKIILF